MAIIKIFFSDWLVALIGTFIMFILMVLLLLFARLASLGSKEFRLASKILLWFVVGLMLATGSLLFTSVFFGWPNNLKHWFTSNPRVVSPDSMASDKTVDESPKARLYIPESARQLLDTVAIAANGMQPEFRSWEELKSEEEREALLTFTDRFELCPQQFTSARQIMGPVPDNGKNSNAHKGIAFDLDIKRGPNAVQVDLRDVVVEVVNFHSVAPTFLGAGISRKPIIVVEMSDLRAPLPWRFQAKWIAESNNAAYRPFNTEQIHITAPSWDGFQLKLLVRDRGIYKFNVFVVLQQDDEPVISKRITPNPLTIGFFSRPHETHPDFEYLQKRFQDRGGHQRIREMLFQGLR